MKEIGLITYHSPHNYGAVLQAYATQKKLEKLGYKNEIINYRTKSEKDFYHRIFITKFGVRMFLKSLLLLPEIGKRKIRIKKFEDFINNTLNLTSKEYRTFEELKDENFNYKALITGSDQTWNINCRIEFNKENKNVMLPYFLAFETGKVRKISFSSSIGSMPVEELKDYKNYLKEYSALSIRERSSAEQLSGYLNKEVYNTIDPTFMLTAEDWGNLATKNNEKDYIFVYILYYPYFGFKNFLKYIYDYAKNRGLEVICVAPFNRTNVKGVKNCIDCGPLDFLSYIKNAKLVITNSYHGTLFSINFGVAFYSLEKNSSDSRKSDVLKKFGLTDRIINSIEEISEKKFDCDFSHANKVLEQERKYASDYLVKSLGENK